MRCSLVSLMRMLTDVSPPSQWSCWPTELKKNTQKKLYLDDQLPQNVSQQGAQQEKWLDQEPEVEFVLTVHPKYESNIFTKFRVNVSLWITILFIHEYWVFIRLFLTYTWVDSVHQQSNTFPIYSAYTNICRSLVYSCHTMTPLCQMWCFGGSESIKR